MIDLIVRIVAAAFNVLFFGVQWVMRNFLQGNSDSLTCLNGKTAIVTGASRGIGLQTATLLASRGCTVILASRSDAREARNSIIKKTGDANVKIKKLDLNSFKSIRAFAKYICETEKKIDILINNAGTWSWKGEITEDNLDSTIQTNLIGPFLLTHLLSSKLKESESGRIVFLTSGLAMFHFLTDKWLETIGTRVAFFKYAHSKAGCILLGQEFAKKLRKFDILVNAADPGVSETDLFKRLENGGWTTWLICKVLRICIRDTLNAAQTSFHLATSNKVVGSGELYFRCENFPKMPIFNNSEWCDKSWRKCEELAQLTPKEKLFN